MSKMFKTNQIAVFNHLKAKCDEAAYKILSDSSISKTTASMSEEGREAVADCISKKFIELLTQEKK